MISYVYTRTTYVAQHNLSSVFCLWVIWGATWKRFYCALFSLPAQISRVSQWAIGKFAYLQNWWPDEVRCGAAWSSHRWCPVPGRVQSLQIVRGSLHGQLQGERERGRERKRWEVWGVKSTSKVPQDKGGHWPFATFLLLNFANSCQRKERTNRQQTVPAVQNPHPPPLLFLTPPPDWSLHFLIYSSTRSEISEN